MPQQAPQGAQTGNVSQKVALSSSVTRTMPEDLRRVSGTPTSASGSGKVLWPSGGGGVEAPVPAPAPAQEHHTKGGFFSSLLQPRHVNAPAATPPTVSSSAQKIPIQGEGSGSVWDKRVPSPEGSATRPATPLSALPIPQKPIVPPAPLPTKPVVAVSAPPLAATPGVTPRSILMPPIVHPIPPRPPQVSPVIPPPSKSVSIPIPPPAPSAPIGIKKIPPPVAPAPTAHPTLIQPPRPASHGVEPRTIMPVSMTPTRAAHTAVDDDDIGIDLGISEYLKGGPTFQIAPGTVPIANQKSQSILRPLSSASAPSAPIAPAALGGAWNPPNAPTQTPSPVPAAPAKEQVAAPKTIFSPTPTPAAFSVSTAKTLSPASSSQYASPKPTQSNADLDAERARLESERAQVVGAKSAIGSAVQSLVSDKQHIEDQMKPLILRETQLANDVDELERKEQGLAGELRRAIERDRWTKVEERRKVEQERMLIKRRQVSIEGELHAKEEEQVSLVRREKDIDARILWISGEYKRREVRMKLAGVNQEKSTIEEHRTILSNGLKRLKTSLEETERNERRLSETKRALAVKLPLNIAEEDRFSQERFDLEKQIHDLEIRRWSLEDELKHATELFAKEDMAYLDVMHRAEALEGELKTLG